MNLNDLTAFRALDSSDILSTIQATPGQLVTAYQSGLADGLAGVDFSQVRILLAVGVGDAVIGADLLASYANVRLPIPLVVHRDDHLPAWANGKQTLVFLHPMPEAGDILDRATRLGCQVIWLGKPKAAESALVWESPVKASAGWYFGRLYAALELAGLLPALNGDLDEAVQVMQHSLAAMLPEVPVARNPAKRLAGQFYDRRVMLFAAEFLIPVARLWKMRINTFAKAGADFEIIPEADYNSLAGLDHPVGGIKDLMAVFLRASALSPRNLRQLDLTRQACLQQGINTDFIDARGASRMAQLWTSVLFAEMTAYYLAMAYGVDPGQNEMLEAFHAEMSQMEG